MEAVMRFRIAANVALKNIYSTGQSGATCYYLRQLSTGVVHYTKEPQQGESKRLTEFRKKLRETTPIDDLGEQPLMHPAQKEDPLPAFPNNTNPHTGEVGGPRGPEPTRYGDWERKGRVSDF